MKVSNTSERLKHILNTRGLKQVDVLRLAEPFCKEFNVQLKKNDLSQYVNGKSAPGQFKLTILSLALGVSEEWLMGYDVSIQKADFHLTSREKQLVIAYRAHPEMQPAVNAILGITERKEENVPVIKFAARNGGGIREEPLSDSERNLIETGEEWHGDDDL